MLITGNVTFFPVLVVKVWEAPKRTGHGDIIFTQIRYYFVGLSGPMRSSGGRPMRRSGSCPYVWSHIEFHELRFWNICSIRVIRPKSTDSNSEKENRILTLTEKSIFSAVSWILASTYLSVCHEFKHKVNNDSWKKFAARRLSVRLRSSSDGPGIRCENLSNELWDIDRGCSVIKFSRLSFRLIWQDKLKYHAYI